MPWVLVLNEVIKAGQMYFITSFSAFREKMTFFLSKPFNVGPVVRSLKSFFSVELTVKITLCRTVMKSVYAQGRHTERIGE